MTDRERATWHKDQARDWVRLGYQDLAAWHQRTAHDYSLRSYYGAEAFGEMFGNPLARVDAAWQTREAKEEAR